MNKPIYITLIFYPPCIFQKNSVHYANILVYCMYKFMIDWSNGCFLGNQFLLAHSSYVRSILM